MQSLKPDRWGIPVKRRRQKTVWLFDLDNTLHHASHAILGRIDRAMTSYIMRTLGLDEMAADQLRSTYWRRYGATLLGLMRHHGVDAADFLASAHAFDDLAGMIRSESGLVRLLSRLPGRKILLTNAPTRYAGDVLGHLRLGGQFAKRVAIEQMAVHRRLRPKPDKLMMRRLLARERVAPGNAILVEDTLSHLQRYRALGLRTVWITGWLTSGATLCGARTPRLHRPAYVDLKVKSVAELVRRRGKVDSARRKERTPSAPTSR